MQPNPNIMLMSNQGEYVGSYENYERMNFPGNYQQNNGNIPNNFIQENNFIPFNQQHQINLPSQQQININTFQNSDQNNGQSFFLQSLQQYFQKQG